MRKLYFFTIYHKGTKFVLILDESIAHYLEERKYHVHHNLNYASFSAPSAPFLGRRDAEELYPLMMLFFPGFLSGVFILPLFLYYLYFPACL